MTLPIFVRWFRRSPMLAALGAAQAAEGDDLKDYLVDINGGANGGAPARRR